MPTPSNPWGEEHSLTTVWSTGELPSLTPCSNVYRSARVSGYFYKECPTGQHSSGVYLIVPEGKFASVVSQADANAIARQYLNDTGPTLANVQGTCELGEFNEIFGNLRGAVNWDWVADRDVDFPHYTHRNYGVPGSANLALTPLMGSYVHLSESISPGWEAGNMFEFTDGIEYDLHNEFGFLHLNYTNFHPELPNLAVYRAEVVAGIFGESSKNGPVPPLMYANSNFMSCFVGDFGSAEVHETSRMGGALFTLVTSRMKREANGKLSGIYHVCYKGDDINVWEYDAGTEEYEIVYTIPFSMKGVSAYLGCSILINKNTLQFESEIYLNGAWQLTISDADLLYVMPAPYLRGQTSCDYWWGDIFVGRINQFANRIPPVLHVIYLPPTSIVPAPPAFDEVEEKWYLPPTSIYNDQTAEEANALPVSLKGGSADRGFYGNWPNYVDSITTQGLQVFASCQVYAKFDYRGKELPRILYGASALIVHHWRTKAYLKEEYPGNQREFMVPLGNAQQTLIQLPGNPYVGGLYEPTVFDMYYANSTDLIRPVCWASTWGAPDYHPMDNDYRVACDSMDLIDSMDSTMLDLDRLAELYYLPAAAWGGARVFQDAYSEIRTFQLKTGAPGIRTREPLEAPVYSPPVCPAPVSCATYPCLLTATVQAVDSPEGVTASTIKICDSLFPGVYNVEKGGWDWDITVQDTREIQGDGSFGNPVLYGPRFILVNLSMVSPELMESYLGSSSQLSPLTNIKGIQLRVYLDDTSFVDQKNQLTAWPIPVYIADLDLSHATLNAPALPPSGGPGMPPSATLIYGSTAGSPNSATEPPALALKAGSWYRFEIYGRDTEKPPLNYEVNP